MSWLKKLFGRGGDSEEEVAVAAPEERPHSAQTLDSGLSEEEQERTRAKMEAELAEQREELPKE